MNSYKSPKAVQLLTAAILCLFILTPVVMAAGLSLKSTLPVRQENLAAFIENSFSLKQYQNIMFHNPVYWKALWNTLWLAVPSVLLTVIFSTLAAYGLISSGRSNRALVLGYMMLALLPAQVLLVPNFVALSGLHLTGSRLAVILTCCFNPYYVYFVYRFSSGLPAETLEAARMEGAGELQVYRHIVLPQIAPGILTLILIAGADLWNMVEQPLAFLQSPGKFPLAMLFRELEGGIQYAGSILFSLPMAVLFLCCGQDLVQGLEGKDA